MAPQIDANLAASAPCGHDPTVLRARRSRQFGGVVTRVAGNFTKGASETAARRGTRSRVGRPPDAAARPLAGQQPVAKSPRCISSGDASRLRPASVAFGSDCRPATPTGSLHRSRRRLPAALFVGCICPNMRPPHALSGGRLGSFAGALRARVQRGVSPRAPRSLRRRTATTSGGGSDSLEGGWAPRGAAGDDWRARSLRRRKLQPPYIRSRPELDHYISCPIRPKTVLKRRLLAWIIREGGDSGGDTGASVWYKRCAHKRLATTETPA